MYKILKYGRIGIISPIPKEEIGIKLEKEMSYLKAGAEFFPNIEWARVKLYKIKTGRFPWGLLNSVLKVLNSNNIEYNLKNIEIEIDYDKLKQLSPKLRMYQKDAILRLILNNGGILSMPTGSGKTFTIIEYLKYMGKRALVIVPTLDLVEQWKKQLPDFVDVINYHKIKDKNYLKPYEIVVGDETHRVAAKTIYNIFINAGDSIVCGVSATPYREDKEDKKIIAACGDIIYQIDRKPLIDQGYLANCSIVFLKLLNRMENEKYHSYHEIYKEMIVNNEERNERIIESVIKEQGKKILIIIHEIEHGEILKEMLNKKNINCKYFHGAIKDRELKEEDKVVIASSIWDEGVDIPEFEVLILAAGGKSSIKVTQRIGRILRPKTDGRGSIVYDFIDKSKYLRKHYNRRREIVEKDFIVTEE